MKVALIIPYFGKLPEYFDLYLKSCEINHDYHWFIFTDDDRDYITPDNVTINKTTLHNLKINFEDKLGFEISLNRPYKLCDYKPAYGFLFNDYIKEFDYWGYCDLDMIFGKLSDFIDLEKLSKYTKILNRGHLSLYKNSPEVNRYFMLKNTILDYKKVYESPESFAFDEWNGIHTILNEYNIPQYHDEFIIDVNPNKLKFEFTHPPYNKQHQFFIYKDKKVYQVYLDNNKLIWKEFAYIHFQKRSMFYTRTNNDNESIVFNSNGFNIISNDELKSYFFNYKNEPIAKTVIFQLNHYKKRIIKKLKSINY